MLRAKPPMIRIIRPYTAMAVPGPGSLSCMECSFVDMLVVGLGCGTVKKVAWHRPWRAWSVGAGTHVFGDWGLPSPPSGSASLSITAARRSRGASTPGVRLEQEKGADSV